MKISFYGDTNTGRQRDHNEDSFLILCYIDNNWQEVNNTEVDLARTAGAVFVVADGMGGANAGEVASDIAVKTIRERIMAIPSLPAETSEVKKFLHGVLMEGHNKIVRISRNNDLMEGMGTTIVVGVFIKDTLFVIWSGDSRCYIYNKNTDKELLPFTDDHSLVWERVRNNELNAEQARLSDDSNLILQSLGGTLQKPEPEFKYIRLKDNDRILFCSDGLNSMLSSIGIQQILDCKSSPLETCDSLIQAANNAGGRDNITVIIVDTNSKGEIITEPGKNIVEAKKKKHNYLPLILFLAFITACGIFFRTQIIQLTGSFFKRGSKQEITQPVLTIDKTTSGNEDTATDSLKVPAFSQDKFKQDLTPEINKQKSTDKNKIKPDSSFLSVRLQDAADKISLIKNNIKMIEPQGVLYNQDFYDKNKPKFDSILSDLDIQEKLLRSVANFNSGNKISKITDFVKANQIFEKLINTLANLEESTDDIINK
ncbi:MAG TPA: hypothetical protein DDW27_05510 [Bacteroidales bacterium]|nr:hypothetical protein [Bacteroidales bacterium]